MRPISSEDDQTVQFHLFEIILHGLDFIDIVFLDYPHFFKGLAGGSKNRSPQRQNAGKIRLFPLSGVYSHLTDIKESLRLV